ncbi:alpha/beta hydrolase [Bradyrhizobium sp. LHD-71]|uniref:alpha/beta hydrolase n=1 Tax=Bradyrhizobium sp. LHD-71 TaxID=3072141 RepID=UPI00280DCAFF|nr:alpha/beta hydrolase [Bradyrhizobium sp. LHD-71]MDQ8729070.1 alpha/beta hydrolase [Bradyrhizobium sp. LHD-71]
MSDHSAKLAEIPLPPGIRARMVPDINGLTMHVLEAGVAGRPVVLLLHGFPELAYSWRKVMLPLADAGFHVIAPDQRGYGRTVGWSADYDGDLRPFSLLNLVRDALGLVSAFGLRSVAAVVGHDFGASVAAWCALVRPDVFRAVTLMSAPFAGPPAIPFDTVNRPAAAKAPDPIHADLAALARPRKHYQWFYSTREANTDMQNCPQGVHAFLRAYYHHKSADWPDNRPRPLAAWTADELAKLPTYYVMDLDKGMAATVAEQMPSAKQIAACPWLTERELSFYSAEYERIGFQGGLQWYRCGTSARFVSELEVFTGRTIDVPSCFISGASDWGIHQRPGALDAMQRRACTQMLGLHLLEGAGHWVQQEQPERVSERLLAFLSEASQRGATDRPA